MRVKISCFAFSLTSLIAQRQINDNLVKLAPFFLPTVTRIFFLTGVCKALIYKSSLDERAMILQSILMLMLSLRVVLSFILLFQTECKTVTAKKSRYMAVIFTARPGPAVTLPCSRLFIYKRRDFLITKTCTIIPLLSA